MQGPGEEAGNPYVTRSWRKGPDPEAPPTPSQDKTPNGTRGGSSFKV